MYNIRAPYWLYPCFIYETSWDVATVVGKDGMMLADHKMGYWRGSGIVVQMDELYK